MSSQGNENTNESRLLSKFAIFKWTVSGVSNPAGERVCSTMIATLTGVTVREAASASASWFPDPCMWLRGRRPHAPVRLRAFPESCKTPPILSGCPHCTVSESSGCHFTLPLGHLLLDVRWGTGKISQFHGQEPLAALSLLLNEFLNQMRSWRDDMLVITPSVSPWTAMMAEASRAGKANPYPEYVILLVSMNLYFLHDGRGPTEPTCHEEAG